MHSELLQVIAASMAWGTLHLHHAVSTTSAHSWAGVSQAHTLCWLLRTKRLGSDVCAQSWEKEALPCAPFLLPALPSPPHPLLVDFKFWKHVNSRLYVNEKTPSQALSRGPPSLTISLIYSQEPGKVNLSVKARFLL